MKGMIFMKHTVKKVFALVLAAVLCLSFSGCYSENNLWSAKKGDETLSIGSYIYFLNSAYSLARAEVSTDEAVLKASIPDYLDESQSLDAKTWIQNRAMNYVNSFFFLKDKFNEYGLSLSEDDQAGIDSLTDSMWGYSKTTYEEMGISKESMNQAYSVYNVLFQRVFDAMYGEGGEKEVSKEEIKPFFLENYVHYEYFTASLTKTGEDGNSIDMTDEEKTAAKEKLDDYVERINKGTLLVEDAANEFALEHLDSADNSTYRSPVVLYHDDLSDTFKDALDGLEEGKAALAETATGYYVIRKLPIAEKHEEYTGDESSLTNLLSYMKGDEFSDYILEQSQNYTGVEYNMSAINTVKLSKFVSESTEYGTSSASDEE